MNTSPLSLTEMTIGSLLVSSCLPLACGSSSGTPTVSSGAVTMKMIEQHQHDVDERRDVDFAHRRMPAAPGRAGRLPVAAVDAGAQCAVLRQVRTSICRETMAANSSAKASRRWRSARDESAENLL